MASLSFLLLIRKPMGDRRQASSRPPLRSLSRRKSLPKRGLFALAAALLSAFAFSSAKAADALDVALDWFINPDHAPLIVALENGFFADENLEVRLFEPGDPNDPPKLVAAGRSDLAISYQPQLHIHVDRGLPLTRIATLVAGPLNSLVVLADGPIGDIGDLRGRKVGFSVAGFEDTLLAAMLEKHGLALSDVEKIHVNFALTPALMSGSVDAVIGAFRNFELHQIEIAGGEGRAFFVEEEGVPAYDELIVVAHSDNLDDPRLPRFLRALERGVNRLINHPQESWDDFRRRYPQADNELNRRAWDSTLPRFALRPRAFDERRYRNFARFLEERRMIATPPPLETYAVAP